MRYREDAFRFLLGTPAIPALYAAREGPKIVREAGIAAIREKSIRQTALVAELARRRGFRSAASPDPARRGGTVAVEVPNAPRGVARAQLARRRRGLPAGGRDPPVSPLLHGGRGDRPRVPGDRRDPREPRLGALEGARGPGHVSRAGGAARRAAARPLSPLPVPAPLRLLFAALTGVLWIVSRGKWSDALIDSGREWIVPDALAKGALLYRDVVYWFGPLTPYLQAGVFRLAGSGFPALVLAGAATTAACLFLLAAASRRVTGRREALLWAALAVPALFFMPNAGRLLPRNGVSHLAGGRLRARRGRSPPAAANRDAPFSAEASPASSPGSPASAARSGASRRSSRCCSRSGAAGLPGVPGFGRRRPSPSISSSSAGESSPSFWPPVRRRSCATGTSSSGRSRRRRAPSSWRSRESATGGAACSSSSTRLRCGSERPPCSRRSPSGARRAGGSRSSSGSSRCCSPPGLAGGAAERGRLERRARPSRRRRLRGRPPPPSRPPQRGALRLRPARPRPLLPAPLPHRRLGVHGSASALRLPLGRRASAVAGGAPSRFEGSAPDADRLRGGARVRCRDRVPRSHRLLREVGRRADPGDRRVPDGAVRGRSRAHGHRPLGPPQDSRRRRSRRVPRGRASESPLVARQSHPPSPLPARLSHGFERAGGAPRSSTGRSRTRS